MEVTVAQRGGIAVNDIDLLHGIQLERPAEQRIQKQKYNVHSNGDAHGIKQPGAFNKPVFTTAYPISRIRNSCAICCINKRLICI